MNDDGERIDTTKCNWK